MSRKKRSDNIDSLATPGLMRKIWMFIDGLPGLRKYSLRLMCGIYPGVWIFYVADEKTKTLIESVLHPTMKAAIYIDNGTAYIRAKSYNMVYPGRPDPFIHEKRLPLRMSL